MKERKSGHASGMAGEFFVMERLFRLGHEPALTLGNAKSIDIIVRTSAGKLKTVSVKSARGGGKWGVDKHSLSEIESRDLVFVFLLYKSFEDVTSDPLVWIMKAADVKKRKRPWFDKWAIYYSHRQQTPADLEDFKNAWHLIA
jgi:hypothetical protein